MNKNWIVLWLLIIPAILFSQNIPVNKLKAYGDIDHGNYQSAMDTLNILLQDEPNQELYLAKANVLYLLGNFTEAFLYCGKADKLNSSASSELKLKIYLKLDDYEKVKASLENNLRSKYKIPLFKLFNNPDFSGIYNLNLNDFILSGNFYSQTEKQIYQIQRLINSEKENQALFILDEMLSRNQNVADVHYLKSKLLFQNGDDFGALQAVNSAVSLDKSNPEYRKQRINIYSKFKRYNDALSDAEKLVRLEPGNTQNYITTAELLFETNQFEKSSELTESLMKIWPQDPDLLYLKGKSYYMKEDYFKALKAINACMDIRSNKEVFELRGDIYSVTNTFEYAIRDYSMYLDIEPYNGDIYAKKGLARLNAGDKKGACYDWKRGKRYGSYEAAEYFEKYCQ